MASNHLPDLLEFKALSENLETKRDFLIDDHNFKSDDLAYIRSLDDAKIILDFLSKAQTFFWKLLKECPSLTSFFEQEYAAIADFFDEDNIYEIIFLEDSLFPEREMFLFGQDGGINLSILDIHLGNIETWCQGKKNDHTEAQHFIREQFDLDIKLQDLKCRCISCSADYRTKLREHIFQSCTDEIDHVEKELSSNESLDLDSSSALYQGLKSFIEGRLKRVKFRLKKASLTRLESQLKNNLQTKFNYPSPLAMQRVSFVRPYLKGLLFEEGLPDDLVTDEEFDKFFTQLSSNIWKAEKYLKREFKAMMKSILILKKKDVSSTILQEYLGEFWEHSIARTIKRKIIYHMGPTNSGKTYHAIEALAASKTGCYLAPLRLLAGELYDTLNQKNVVTTLLTGEEVIEKENSTHYSSTIEMARLSENFDCCVIDEIQMITDPQRGWAWTRALVNMFAPEVHICGDASVLDLVEQIVRMCGDELEIKNYTRMTELNVEKSPTVLGQLAKADALIVFSRKNALRYKSDLERVGFKVSIVYGRLSPEVRREQARKFDVGETDIMVSTDAISMGMNLPIKRIVFSTLSKFINSQEHPITDSEIKQIAGRAGRFKRFPVGYVTCLEKVEDGNLKVTQALNKQLPQKLKCMVGPDLDIFSQVNKALEDNGLTGLKLSEFLRLFNTMIFKKPFFCVELKEMIELAEMVEDADPDGELSTSEIFGFACAPVNMGLLEHVQYYIWILNNYVNTRPIKVDGIDYKSDDIDYLETSIKCIELYQWLARHFKNKNFDFDDQQLMENKGQAVDQLNALLSEKIVRKCSSCGKKISDESKFFICEDCFKGRRFSRSKSTRFSRDKGTSEDKKKKGSFRSKSGKPFKKRTVKRKTR